MIPLAEARKYVASACEPLKPSTRAVIKCSGHVLAETVRAIEAVPPFANSAMDGYAVRAADTAPSPARLRVVGSAMAGDNPKIFVDAGEAVRIMTGAPIPPGADAVCMIEHTRVEKDGATVLLEQSVDLGTNVRSAGEDVEAGDEVFGPGTHLGPAHIGVLISVGVERVLVHSRPAVGVLSTGDELVTTSGPPAPGKIRDSNRPTLLAQLARDGFDAIDLGTAGDDEMVLASVFTAAGSRCDAIITSGGVSVGDLDITRTVLSRLCGTTTRWMQIAIKPAKPFAFGVLEQTGTPVFGLPGNPVSALVSYELLVRPALRTMAGFTVLDRPRLAAIADMDLSRRPDGKLHLMRVTARVGADGALRVRSAGGQGSHMMRAMAHSNALALLPDGEGTRTGESVEVLLLDSDGLATELEEPK